MTLVTNIALAGLALSAGLLLIRLVRGPGVPDRLVALEALLIVVVSAVAIESLRQETQAFLNVLAVVALVGFVGTVAAARYIESRGT